MNNNIWFGIMVVSLIVLIACLSPLIAWGANSVEFKEDNIEMIMMLLIGGFALSAVGLYASVTKYQWRTDSTYSSLGQSMEISSPQPYRPESDYGQLEMKPRTNLLPPPLQQPPKSYGYPETPSRPLNRPSEEYTHLPVFSNLPPPPASSPPAKSLPPPPTSFPPPPPASFPPPPVPQYKNK